MSLEESYRDRTFVVDDPDARIRRDDDLMAFVPSPGGGFKTLAKGSSVKIVEVRLE